MLISAIVPVYKGAETLPRFFESIRELHPVNGIELEIVLCVDGLNEDISHLVPVNSFFPVRIINQDHAGQSTATNLAAKHATGEFLWLLVQDVTPKRDALQELIERGSYDSRLLVQGNIVHSPELMEDRFTNFITNDSNFQFHFQSIKDVNNLKPGHHYAPHALVNRKRFVAVGGYDPALPFGFQDTDFGLRWKINGNRIVFAENSIVYHHHLFDLDGYYNRLYRIGKACVDFFQKWNKEPLISQYVTDLENNAAVIVPVIKRVESILSLWKRTQSDPNISFDANVVDIDLNDCFRFYLQDIYNRGMADRYNELNIGAYSSLHAKTDPYVPGGSIFDWVENLAENRSSPASAFIRSA